MKRENSIFQLNLMKNYSHLGGGEAFLVCGGGERPRLTSSAGLCKKNNGREKTWSIACSSRKGRQEEHKEVNHSTKHQTDGVISKRVVSLPLYVTNCKRHYWVRAHIKMSNKTILHFGPLPAKSYRSPQRR